MYSVNFGRFNSTYSGTLVQEEIIVPPKVGIEIHVASINTENNLVGNWDSASDCHDGLICRERKSDTEVSGPWEELKEEEEDRKGIFVMRRQI